LCGSFPRLMANGFAKKCLAMLASKDDGFIVFRRTGTAGRIRPTKQVSAHGVTVSLFSDLSSGGRRGPFS
jgi:hypothetical protein